MKQLILSSFILLFLFSCTDEGYLITQGIEKEVLFDKEFVDSGSFEEALLANSIILDKKQESLEELKAEFELMDKESSTYKIVKEPEGMSIIISDISNQTKTAIWIVPQEVNGETIYRTQGSKCTCTGCTKGCSPRRDENGDCYCTDCDSGKGVVCTKTESI